MHISLGVVMNKCLLWCNNAQIWKLSKTVIDRSQSNLKGPHDNESWNTIV